MEASAKKTGVIFVHGIQGSPRQFDFLIERLPEGVPYRAVLLPGHGSTVREYNRSGGKWLEAVKKECAEFKKQCGSLVFVGHSMGCLLGMLASEETRFSSMLLLCCPFRIRMTPRFIRGGLLLAFTGIKTKDADAQALREANSVTARTPFAYLTCVRPFLKLFSLMRLSRKKRGPLAAPAVFMFSEHDEIVSKRSESFARSLPQNGVETIADSGHSYFSEEGKRQIVERLLAML